MNGILLQDYFHPQMLIYPNMKKSCSLTLGMFLLKSALHYCITTMKIGSEIIMKMPKIGFLQNVVYLFLLILE